MDARDETMEHDFQQSMEELRIAQRAWKAKWLNHCPVCLGKGGIRSYEDHPYGATTASEEFFDDCEECTTKGICARCGSLGLTYNKDEFYEGPCSFCDWNFDDECPHL